MAKLNNQQLFGLRSKSKLEMVKPNSNCTKGHKIRDHAKCEITEHYGVSTVSMKTDKTRCPICDSYQWVTEVLHIKEIKEFLDSDLLGDINHIYNLLPDACVFCHRFFDWGTKIKNFASYPPKYKIDWYKHRIKVYEAGKLKMLNIGYRNLGMKPFENPVNFDLEIENCKKKIRQIESNPFIWDLWGVGEDVLFMEDPDRWFGKNPNVGRIKENRMTTLSEYEDKLLNEDGEIPNGSKRFDRTRTPAKMEYRFSEIPYRCIIPGCKVYNSLEIAHFPLDLEDYPSDALGCEFNNTLSTAPLCKGHHNMIAGNVHMKQSNEYYDFLRIFEKAHKEFKSKYSLKEVK